MLTKPQEHCSTISCKLPTVKDIRIFDYRLCSTTKQSYLCKISICREKMLSKYMLTENSKSYPTLADFFA